MKVDYSQTYLYKLHRLTNSLDKLFDQTLRNHADISFSQFTLMLSIDKHQPTTQRTIADFLDLSPGAISRQVDVARQNGLISVSGVASNRRAQSISLTQNGEAAITRGLNALEQHVFHLFDRSDDSMHLMGHIDMLSNRITTSSRC